MPTISIVALSLAQSALIAAPSAPVLDGISSWPLSQVTTYSISCPDGVAILEVAQAGKTAPVLRRLTYAGRPLPIQARKTIASALARLRTLESIGPRCLTAGGVQFLLAGLERNRDPSKKLVIGATIRRNGRVWLN